MKINSKKPQRSTIQSIEIDFLTLGREIEYDPSIVLRHSLFERSEETAQLVVLHSDNPFPQSPPKNKRPFSLIDFTSNTTKHQFDSIFCQISR